MLCIEEKFAHRLCSFFSLESVEWLEAFLRNQNLPMVIVSHDREFLDQVCTKIVDAEGGICTEYNGNYSRFLQLKKGVFVENGRVPLLDEPSDLNF